MLGLLPSGSCDRLHLNRIRGWMGRTTDDGWTSIGSALQIAAKAELKTAFSIDLDYLCLLLHFLTIHRRKCVWCEWEAEREVTFILSDAAVQGVLEWEQAAVVILVPDVHLLTFLIQVPEFCAAEICLVSFLHFNHPLPKLLLWHHGQAAQPLMSQWSWPLFTKPDQFIFESRWVTVINWNPEFLIYCKHKDWDRCEGLWPLITKIWPVHP